MFQSPAAMRSEIGTKKPFDIFSKVPSITHRFRPNYHYLWSVGGGCCQVWLFSHHASMRGEIGKKMCLGHKSKEPQEYLARECQVWYFSHPAAIRREIGPKNFRRQEKRATFITDRFRPNLLCLRLIDSVWHLRCFSHPDTIPGEIWTRSCFDL
jgi:hypothetical protein